MITVQLTKFNFIFILENIVQKRWKVLREKFSLAYRKYQNEGVKPNWNLYEECSFLKPYVKFIPELNKEESNEILLSKDQRVRSSPFDENLLMQLVKERPILYDKQHEDSRAVTLRKQAWQEVAKVSGWDLKTVTKRWRVMRDRFVRELRRTKNMENSETYIQCSAFFTDMLFLVNHVKSKSYVAEASGIEELSPEKWERQDKEADSKSISGQFETRLDSNSDSNKTEDSVQAIAYPIDENDEFVECYAAPETTEEDETFYDDSNDFYEEETLETDESNGEEHEEKPGDAFLVEEIPEEQWFKKTLVENPNLRKRQKSIDQDFEQPATKSLIKDNSVPELLTVEVVEDEDVVFGRTIGLMLKKIPTRLKTAVKLKLFQSLAEFEIEHKLNEPK